MRIASVCVMATLLASAVAGADAGVSVGRVRLVMPVVPAAMDRDLRDALEDALASARAMGELERVGGARREPCGIVSRRGDRVVARTSLVWRDRRIVTSIEWDERNEGDPVWRRTRSVFHDGRVGRELHDSMQYTDGRADCPTSSRRVFARDAGGRIVSVRSTVDTCEGVDSGTFIYRHVWRHRAGVAEAIVRGRHELDDGPSRVSVRAFVPSERDAWAELGGDGFTSRIDLRDTEGFLRVSLEHEGEIGSYEYACDGSEWPRGPRAPDVIE